MVDNVKLRKSAPDRTPPASESWQDFDWRAHTFDIVVDGIRLRLVDIGHGPAVLLVHGLGGNWQFWLKNISHIARNHRVIAVDLPGFGASECPRGGIRMDDLARSLGGLLVTLDISSVTIVGHSMGGIVSQRFALAYPELVDRIMLVGSGGLGLRVSRRIGLVVAGMALNGILGNRYVGPKLLRSEKLCRAALAKIVVNPSCISNALREEIAAGFGARGFNRAVRSAVREDLRGELGDIRCPTLLLYGDADPLAPPAYAKQMAELISGAELVMWNRVGHAPMLELPDEFNRVLGEFVAAAEAPAAGA